MPDDRRNRPKQPRLGTGPIATPRGEPERQLADEEWEADPADEPEPEDEAVPDEVTYGDTSMAIADPAVRAASRARRTTTDRIARVEVRVDGLTKVVYDMRGGIRTLVRQGERREARELADAQARSALIEAAANRRAALWRVLLVKVLGPIAVGLGAFLAAYKAVGK